MPHHPMASGGEYLSNISTYHDARSQSSARAHATVMSPGQQSASQLSAALHRQIKSLKKENQQLKRQLDGKSVDKSPNSQYKGVPQNVTENASVAKIICDNFSQNQATPKVNGEDFTDLRETVMCQIERIQQLEQILDELKSKKKGGSNGKSKRSLSAGSYGGKSPMSAKSRKSTLDAPPSIMNQSRKSNKDLFNIFQGAANDTKELQPQMLLNCKSHEKDGDSLGNIGLNTSSHWGLRSLNFSPKSNHNPFLNGTLQNPGAFTQLLLSGDHQNINNLNHN